MLYTPLDHLDINIYTERIKALRSWMKDRGYQNTPLVSTEYGELYPLWYLDDFGLTQMDIDNFIRGVINHMNSQRDLSIGYPADDYRLIQRVALYSLDDDTVFPYDPPDPTLFRWGSFSFRSSPPYTRTATGNGLVATAQSLAANVNCDLITWTYYVDTMDVKPSPIHLSDQHGATGWILRHGKTLADVDGSVAKAIKQGEIEAIGTNSDGIGVPLKSDDKMIGVLIVQSYKPDNKYTLEDIEILNFIAKHISTALTRARAIEETRQRNAELEIVNSVQQGLASQLDLQAIIDLVGDKLQAIFDAQVVSIDTDDRSTDMLYNWYTIEKGQRMSSASARMFRPYGFRRHVIETREPLVINQNIDRLMEEYHNPVVVGEPVKSAVFVPMIAGDHISGIISLQNIDRENAFSDSDVRLLQTLANSMSVALENARLFDELQQRNREISEALDQQTATSDILGRPRPGRKP